MRNGEGAADDFRDRRDSAADPGSGTGKGKFGESLLDAIIELDPDGRIIYGSSQVRDLLGYDYDEYIGRSAFDLIHPDDIQRARQSMIEAINSDHLHIVKCRIKHKDGSFVPMSVAGRTIRMGEGVRIIATFRDMSDINATRDALSQRTILLESILNAIPDIIGIQDTDHRIIQYNEAGYRFLNLEPEDAIGRRCYELIGRKVPCDVCATKEVYSTKMPASVNKYIPELDTWLDVRAYPVLDSNGDILYVIEHLRDITGEKENQEKLIESEEKFRSLVETTSDWIWEINKDGRYVYSSPKVKELLGYEPDEIIGKTPVDLMDEESREKFTELLGFMLGNPQPYSSLENTNVRKDGIPVVLDTSAVPVYGPNGVFKGYRGIDRDMTYRKMAEEEIKRRLEFDNLISSISTDFINLPSDQIDSAVNDTLRRIGEFIEVDRSYVFIYNEEGTLMSNTHEWCREGISTERDSLQDLDAEQFYIHRYFLVKREIVYIPDVEDLPEEADFDKSEFRREGIQSLICVPMTSEDEMIGFIGFDSVRKKINWSDMIISLLKIVGEIIVNAILRKRAHDELIQERNRAEFYLDLLSHDIGNLHQGIYSGIQIAGMESISTDKKEIALNSARDLLLNSMNMVKNIIILSRIRSKNPELAEVDIGKVVRMVVRTMENMYPQSELQIGLKAPEEPIVILAEPIIEEIFFNLIHNGIKFQTESPPRVDIELRSEGGEAVVTVSDHGPGIPDDMKTEIFNRFMTMGDGSRTGIGLYIVFSLLRRYDGKILVLDRVEGDPASGALFRLSFPSVRE
ncbi:MAG: PAS domain S-box protein [Thermoplasmatota archaeon]